MATAREYGAIAVIISVAIIGVVKSGDIKEYFLPDPVKAHYEMLDRECAKPRPDGGRREIVYTGQKENYGYFICSKQ